ncbi:MAG: hypothetical protein KAI84_00645, partial [Gammaproteobacteria bacterium]|nr:hypothetical protein [Gammaproteobacteria bacterium]
MKIVFHENYGVDYASDGASVPGRMESIMDVLVENDRYKVISPQPASYEDILRAHSPAYAASTKKDPAVFEMAL